MESSPPSWVRWWQRFPPRSPVQGVSVYISNVLHLYTVGVPCSFSFLSFSSLFFPLSLYLSLISLLLSISLLFSFFFSYLSSTILTYVNTETREGHSRGGRRNRVCWGRLFNIYISEAPKHLLPGHRKRFGRGKGRDWRLSANIYARSVLKILLGILMKSSRDAEGVGR